MSENGEIYTAGKNFTLPPALTALTNSTSVWYLVVLGQYMLVLFGSWWYRVSLYILKKVEIWVGVTDA